MRDCVDKVNADLAAEALMGDTQIHRFLILHKELDPDDDELTRTRKVRRDFIADKYAVLIDALYADKASQFISTPGQVRGRPHRHGQRRPAHLRRHHLSRHRERGVTDDSMHAPTACAVPAADAQDRVR